MIRISSFFPMDNLARRTWEFYDENMIVKIKSLTIDFETEIRYEKIKFIRGKKIADLRWVWATFLIMGILGMAKFIFHYFGLSNPAIPFAEKAIVIFGL